jgi:RimJ/RimL family protein N-acetyltransferase
MESYQYITKNGIHITIREPCSSDVKLAMEYINNISLEKRSGILRNRIVNLKEESIWLRKVIEAVNARHSVYLFAFSDGRMVGSCSIDRGLLKHSHRGTFGIAVALNMRRKGLGDALARRTIALAFRRMKGLEIIELVTFAYNKRAHGLYNKLGFRKVAVIPRAVKEDSKYYGEYVMQLELPCFIPI